MNNPLQSVVSHANKAAAASFHAIGKEVSAAARQVSGAVRSAVSNRVLAQKNFENRTGNSNYYGSASSFIKK